MKRRTIAHRLVPLRGVEVDADGYVSLDAEPWLALEVQRLDDLVGSFVEIAYRACFWDEPARPLFRFILDGGSIVEGIAPGPLAAVAFWTGRIPARTRRIHVSPTNRPGRFGFRIEAMRKRAWPALLTGGAKRRPAPTRSALLTRLIGWRPESDNNLAWAIGAHPLGSFPTWLARRHRTLDLEGFDRPRCDWRSAAPIRIVVLCGGCDAQAVAGTIANLRRQVFPRWHAIVVGSPNGTPVGDRVSHAETAGDAASEVAASGGWFTVLTAPAVLAPEALAVVAERRQREPHVKIFYGDETAAGFPLLKPGWSPRLQAARPYLGHAVFAEAAALPREAIDQIVTSGVWPACLPQANLPVPLRRIVLSTAAAKPVVTKADPDGRPAPPQRVRAALIILTRDNPALLLRMVTSIRARTDAGSYRILVVNNSASGAPVLPGLPFPTDVLALQRPGPFNFSRLCNEAASLCDEDVLVFLNDDMEVLSDGWLRRLVHHALEPDVGAVGGRLTYPDGRLQHVGVLAGMGGSAGHFGAPAPGDDAGWAARNTAIHEVSAVTGACLAVARAKFEAVGGFDAEHLPVELSDIDLCLKLDARGWQSLVDPSVHLLHEESFSRGGATLRRLGKYGSQREVFVDRWRHVLRDDPVFHPALSLYSFKAALG